jgi:hypothetical protein
MSSRDPTVPRTRFRSFSLGRCVAIVAGAFLAAMAIYFIFSAL